MKVKIKVTIIWYTGEDLVLTTTWDDVVDLLALNVECNPYVKSISIEKEYDYGN